MTNYPRLTAENNVDPIAECLYRFVNKGNDIFYPHNHDFFEIFIVLSGTASHFINGKDTILPEGSLVFIRPDDIHGFRYETPENLASSHINLTFTKATAENLFIFLSSDFPSKELLLSSDPPTVFLTPFEKEQLVALIGELNLSNWQDKKALKIKMRAILANIFVRYFHFFPKNNSKNIPEWLSIIMNEAEKPENFIGGGEIIIKKCGKSREHLLRCIKKYYGVTLTEYINSLRINYACNLLINTDMPIINISFDCGFQSTSLFYKIFKEKNGLSPLQFRKKNSR